MTDKEEIKFAIRYLKKGLKSKRTPPLYEELMNELGFVKEVKSESCCQRCALPNDLVGSVWCTQHCQHDNRFKRNKEFAELNDKLNNLSSVAEVRLANWQKYEEENKELKELVEKYRQAVDKCLHITFMGGGCEVNTIGQYATLVDGYLTDVEGLAKWKN